MPYRCGLCRASCPNEYSLRQHEAGKKHLRRVALREECVVAKVSGDEEFSSVSSSVAVETTPVEVLDDCADIVGKLMSYAGGSFKAAVVHQDSRALLGILPAPWSEALAAIGMDRVSDISLDLGRRPYCWHDYQRRYLCEDDANHVVEDGHIREIAMGLQNFGDDNRAGIDGQLHRISCIRNNSDGIIGLTIRVGRYVEGNSDMIRDLLEDNNKSILILGEVRALDAAWYFVIASLNISFFVLKWSPIFVHDWNSLGQVRVWPRAFVPWTSRPVVFCHSICLSALPPLMRRRKDHHSERRGPNSFAERQRIHR
jgi:hypothetical protein